MKILRVDRTNNVPRKGVDTYYPRPSEVRTYEKTLGLEFIEMALFFNVNWKRYRLITTARSRRGSIAWPKELREAHTRAIDETEAYFDEYGEMDGHAHQYPNGKWRFYLRKPQIGDRVTIIASNNESDQLYIENEARPTIYPLHTVDYWQTTQHVTGDARWLSMSDADYAVMEKKDVYLEEPISQVDFYWEHGTTPASSKKYINPDGCGASKRTKMKGRWVREGNEWEFQDIRSYDREKQIALRP